MKRLWILFLSILLVACTAPSNGKMIEGETNGKIQVVVSFYPITDFTQRIAGDHAEITTLVDAGVSPHGWELSIEDRNLLEQADLFIYSGSGFEYWVKDLLPTLENEELIVLEASRTVDLRKGHEHDHETGKEEEQNRDSLDYHTWISLRNGVRMLEEIQKALIEADPVNEKVYRANFDSNKKEFEALDKKATELFSGVIRKDFIVGHESFGYFALDYGLYQHGIEDAASHGEPDPKTMRLLVDLAKEKGIRTIFYDPFGSDKAAKTIAEEIGGRVLSLNPLEGRTSEEIASGADYLTIMENNIIAIHKALTE